jgi:hypothetical protein
LMRWLPLSKPAVEAIKDGAERTGPARPGFEFANSDQLGVRLTKGVEFIDENGGGPGVRLRKHQMR